MQVVSIYACCSRPKRSSLLRMSDLQASLYPKENRERGSPWERQGHKSKKSVLFSSALAQGPARTVMTQNFILKSVSTGAFSECQ